MGCHSHFAEGIHGQGLANTSAFEGCTVAFAYTGPAMVAASSWELPFALDHASSPESPDIDASVSASVHHHLQSIAAGDKLVVLDSPSVRHMPKAAEIGCSGMERLVPSASALAADPRIVDGNVVGQRVVCAVVWRYAEYWPDQLACAAVDFDMGFDALIQICFVWVRALALMVSQRRPNMSFVHSRCGLSIEAASERHLVYRHCRHNP